MQGRNNTRRSAWALLPGIVDQPTKTLGNLTSFPDSRWLLPTLLIVVALILLAIVAGPYQAEEARRRIQLSMSNMTPEQATAVSGQLERLSSPTIVIGGSIITGLLGLVTAWLIASALLYFGGLIGGSDLNFGPVWRIIPWTWLPFGLRSLVQAGWIAYQQKLIPYPGLSGLVATGDPMTDAKRPLFALLGQMDLFGLWHLVLIYAALRGGLRLSRNTAIWLTGIYAVISLGFRLGPALLARAFMPSTG